MALRDYRRKRRFNLTPEPQGSAATGPADQRPRFAVQKHAARQLHYDLRLEMDGVLKSWAVPKGPCLDPQEKRLAIHVEDHPLEYLEFEGVIPHGEYGAGEMLVWDCGTWQPLEEAPGYEHGQLKFELNGHKLQGRWMLVKTRRRERHEHWLLFKERDAMARPLAEFDVLDAFPNSVLSGRSLEDIKHQGGRKADVQAQLEFSDTPTESRRQERQDASPPSVDPAQIKGARRATMPRQIRACLPVAHNEPPRGDDWIHEIKFDGYRMVCYKHEQAIRFVSRNDRDWTDRFPQLVQVVRRLPVRDAILDGEVVMLNSAGLSDFQLLQNAISGGQKAALRFFVFDLMYLDGWDLRQASLLDRKACLEPLFSDLPADLPLQFSEHLRGDGPLVFQQICRLGAEGIVSKHVARRYVSGRTDHWRKIKSAQSEEFAIGGYTTSSVSPRSMGALHIGYLDSDGQLRYAGRVGTGFNERSLIELQESLDPLIQKECPFVDYSGDAATLRKTRWVEPRIAAEIEFGSWTRDGRVRFARFKGIRDDSGELTALDVAPSNQAELAEEATAELPETLNQLTLSHPDRILFPESGTTKLGLATYYAQIARWMLPHVVNRPLSLLRCPRGSQEKCFFQKRAPAGLPDLVERIAVDEESAATTMIVKDLAGVLALVQYGVLEFHVWLAQADRIDRPDQLVFDLDPDTEIAWQRVIEAAFLVRDHLAEIGLQSFAKVTGGKGLHLVVPIRRRSTWATAKQFSKQFATRMQELYPGRFTVSSSKRARRGKIYLDYLRNTRGATVIAPFSTRARPRPSVAVPIEWVELPNSAGADVFTVDNVVRRLQNAMDDPWQDFAGVEQSLTRSILAKLPS